MDFHSIASTLVNLLPIPAPPYLSDAGYSVKGESEIHSQSGRGRNRTYDVSVVTGLQPAALAARHTHPLHDAFVSQIFSLL